MKSSRGRSLIAAAVDGWTVSSDIFFGTSSIASFDRGVDLLVSSCSSTGVWLAEPGGLLGDGLGKYDDPSAEYPERSVAQGLLALKSLHRFKAMTNALPSFRGPALYMYVSNKTIDRCGQAAHGCEIYSRKSVRVVFRFAVVYSWAATAL